MICIIFCIVLTACESIKKEGEGSGMSNGKESEKSGMSDTRADGFQELSELPKSTRQQSPDSVIKIMFYESQNMQQKNVTALDLGNKKMYLHPKVQTVGIAEPDGTLSEDDIAEIIAILEENNVQEWKDSYQDAAENASYEDGYSWTLILEYEDRTVEWHTGSGPSKQDVVPDEFDQFTADLIAFQARKAEEA
jgi:hypothetical protein